jgi:hypothetical protein
VEIETFHAHPENELLLPARHRPCARAARHAPILQARVGLVSHTPAKAPPECYRARITPWEPPSDALPMLTGARRGRR